MDFKHYAANIETKKIVTQWITTESYGADERVLQPAAQALARGELVAFPTETVYGLGANAFLAEAVSMIFLAKGRPVDNPLIVHVAHAGMLEGIVREVTPLAKLLLRAFAPGPLTLVMPKHPSISAKVTAGLDTVAVRIPAHPVARQLIELAKVPVAAPSANRSGRPSPTRAWHVRSDLWGRLSYIVDAGQCALGLESTVLDISGETPTILRPGSISAAQIDQAILPLGLSCQTMPSGAAENRPVRAPGMKYRHYAPRAKVELLVETKLQDRQESLLQRVRLAAAEKQWTGVFCSRETAAKLAAAYPLQMMNIRDEDPDDFIAAQAAVPPAAKRRAIPVIYYGDRPDAQAASAALFAALRTLDHEGVDQIIAEGLPEQKDAEAYMNRLRKAAASDAALKTTMPKKRRVLFICTGNTCRSPMAQAIFNLKAEKTGWQAISAGVAALPDMPLSPQAQSVLADLFGIDSFDHAARLVTESLVQEADLVLTMTAKQRDLLRQQYPKQQERILTIAEQAKVSPADLIDPFGQDEKAYRDTAREIAVLLDRIIMELSKDDGQ